MKPAAPALDWDGGDLILRLLIQPRASTDAWSGLQADRVKLRITAPPVDGQANAYLNKFLAKAFKVPKSRVLIESGETGREKRIRIQRPKKIPSELLPYTGELTQSAQRR